VREVRQFLLVVLIAAAISPACSREPDGRTRKTLTIVGTVVEHVDVPPYSYLRIATNAGDVWAMVPTAGVGRGERVKIVDGVLLKDFDTGQPGRRIDVVMGALAR
jgi:hypothetical protein